MEEEIIVSLALYYTETSHEYGACIDISNMKTNESDRDRALLLIEYEDNSQFNNLESIIVQNNVNIVYTYGSVENGKLQNIAKLLDQLEVKLSIVKKALFSLSDVEHELSVLIGEENLNLYPSILSLKNGLKSSGVIVSQLQLCSGSYCGKYMVIPYSMNKYMRLDSSALSTLNIFPAEKVKDKCSSVFGLLNATVTSGMGERLLRRWLRQPLVSAEEIDQRLNLVSLFMKESELRNELRDNALKGIVDIEKYVRRLEGKVRFRLQDLYYIYQTVQKLHPILDCLKNATGSESILEIAFIGPIEELLTAFNPFIEMTERVIDQKSLTLSPPEFNVSPSFNEGLREIADRRNEAYEEITKIYNKMRDRYPMLELRCEHNARHGYCLRALSKYNNEVNTIPNVVILQVLKNGIYFTLDGIHDLRTPSFEYEQYKTEYNRSQQTLIEKIIEVTMTYIPLFNIFVSLISQLDVLIAFAHVSANAIIPFTRPQFIDNAMDNYVEIFEARHPLLEIQSNIQFIPNDYSMRNGIHSTKSNQNVVLITGPNMGGKSTYMRQLGILIIMAQIGCFVPAKSAVFEPFTALYTRIGASDNQSRGVSTFMSEMIDMSNILSSCKDNNEQTNSLMIIDELGRGTSTYDGLGLSWGILEYIIQHIPYCYCLFTTHYYELTSISTYYKNVKNIHVTALSKEHYITMLYGIHDGPSDKSFGINVAQLCNFPKEIVQDAQKKVIELEAIAKVTNKEKENNCLKRVNKESLDAIEMKIRKIWNNPLITEDDIDDLILDIDLL